MTPLKAAPGTILFRPGEPCHGFMMVERGTIRVSLTSASGREVVLYRVGPGDICLQTFSCLFSGQPYGAEGVVEAALEGHLIAAGEFLTRVSQDDSFRDAIFAAVARRFSEFETLVETVALSGLEPRLAGALLRLADPVGRVAVTHEQLAAEVASGRAAVSRQLGAFARAGLVTLERGAVVIADRSRLERIVAGQV